MKHFVLAADEVWKLQHRKTDEARLFREAAEFGHYGGRSMELTRQGIYALTPGGKFLRSWNTRHIPTVLENLKAAQASWEKLEGEARTGGDDLPVEWRWSDMYPSDGLALLVTTRDMPRRDLPAEMKGEWRRNAWNQDRFWMSAEEWPAWLHDEGVRARVAHRFVRIHGRDNARGQTTGYESKQVREARWDVEKVATEGDRVTYAIHGYGAVQQSGIWAINDRRDEPAQHTRSFEGPMRGQVVMDKDRCVSFELAWVGPRTGATQYNGRADDPGPADLGVVITLAPEGDRVAPSLIWQYGWQKKRPAEPSKEK